MSPPSSKPAQESSTISDSFTSTLKACDCMQSFNSIDQSNAQR